ncbi:hypothetical protein CPAR01_00588 [Colletotrichum paranaense]|uniref:Uncharacterized protein n=6 Tax=Colletotrichum acutatum species complex TaxID=2707335 RepID=A0A9Q8T9C3_9PEZI|nr:hypothetical protein CSPX01_15005 [Colletotrichum filicis]KAK1449509.1 hypothetical protein CMEL01_08824 [Colletotrichum melonis]KAK1475910.1 hypothetical protein CTAM01_15576 [Colletotrichum tamarilloi]KAK1491637.1 hypothetical protein CCUS01_14251 [Colletotrichum cuscutae]KAK1513596.1 hypothetical protein CABS01_07002 [Colletotrichum abscissum]KAK1515615.1 hypothetical protein CCOS01_12813 [Colletotrichum costaricense]KAK1546621.1 hypothetical protein CPAR01_00588 [Colletotrichum paranae
MRNTTPTWLGAARRCKQSTQLGP